MAITWDVTIAPLDVTRKEASVVAIRTDSVTEQVETHRIISVILDTQIQKTAAVNQLWQMHLDYGDRQAAIDAFVGALETQAKTILEAKE